MTNQWTAQNECLLTILCAQNWTDTTPVIPEFTKLLVQDKNPNKGLQQIAMASRQWRGSIGTNGILEFFQQGFTALHPEIQPGGFTIFFCRPNDFGTKFSTKEQAELDLHSTKSLFGDSKISDSLAKILTKQSFFLPKDLPELEDQLDVCLDLLSLLTGTGSVATHGYATGKHII